MRFKLQERIFLPVLIVIIFGMGSLIFVSNHYSKNAVKLIASDRIIDNSIGKEKEISSWFKNNKALINTWSSNWVLQSAAKSGVAARVLAIKELEKLNEENPKFSRLAVLSSDGTLIASSKKEKEDLPDFREREFFKKGLVSDFEISNPVRSSFDKKEVIYLTSRLLYSDVTEGLLVCEIELDVLRDEFFSEDSNQIISFTCITDSNGKIILSSSKTINNSIDLSIPKNNDHGFISFNTKDYDYFCAYKFFEQKKWFIVSFSSPSKLFSEVNKLVKINLIIAAAVVVILGCLVFILVRRIIIIPIKKTVKFSSEITNGNLLAKLDLNQKDEIGEMVSELNLMGERFKEIFQIDNLKNLVNDLVEESKNLKKVSIDLNKGSRTASEKSKNVSDSALVLLENLEELNKTMANGVARFDEISSNSQNILKSADNALDYSVKTKKITQNAVELVHESSDKIKSLENLVNGINDITDTIKMISDQTNLLALNATIEAARAGEYGKGFAVVAKEIKELASKTKFETENIAQQIFSIQELTSKTAETFEKMESVMLEADTNAGKISALSETQSLSTSEITKGIEAISLGVKDVYERLSLGILKTSSISESISEVSELSSRLEKNGEELKTCSIGLGNISKGVSSLVTQFQI
ncbi:MAG: methyl-accepting chemotaxis protein [Desulfobacteraceae bacterium]|nr:methyl-accepting chemotaxis protein [Desulfobacteraceae bacterium]